MSEVTWHYPRVQLAEQIMGMFTQGISNALTFFAPRRMGKTEFLRKDITPLALNQGWQVLYFSFLDSDENVQHAFQTAVQNSATQKNKSEKAKHLLARLREFNVGAMGVKTSIKLADTTTQPNSLHHIFEALTKKSPLLLLMDEVQALTQYESNAQFIASLRTALDMHKDVVKVIFTGSSREGLRRMFSNASAPFFHFGQNLPFPALGQEFTDHLAKTFSLVTGRSLDQKTLWQAFIDMQYVPQLARALVERLVLNPELSIQAAKQFLLADIANDREYPQLWQQCSALEQAILRHVIQGEGAYFSDKVRQKFAKTLGIGKISVSSVQSALRSLLKKQILGHETRGGYFIDDPNFQEWITTE